MNVLLIRHGATNGNLEKRYVGSTDEPLTCSCAEKLKQAFDSGKSFGLCRPENLRALYVSPMLRCRMTADLLFPREFYPDTRREEEEDLRECDFGRFEYKNYLELSGDPAYQHFIDTGGTEGFPEGETTAAFKERCIRAFRKTAEKEYACAGEDTADEDTLAFLVHGGTIMSVLETFAVPHRDYYSWQVKNTEGFRAVIHKNNDGGFYLTDIAKVRIL